MKKNANILEYVEKYKYKYGISYADENSNLVSNTIKFIKFFMICMVVLVFAMEWSLYRTAQYHLKTTDNPTFASVNTPEFAANFYTILICGVVLLALIFIIKKFKYLSAIALVALPLIIYSIDEWSYKQGGQEHIAMYYVWLVPAAIICVAVLFLLYILIRAQIKTNAIYSMLIDGLYRQHGTHDGEKLTGSEWEAFLSNYNPHKQVVKEDLHN